MGEGRRSKENWNGGEKQKERRNTDGGRKVME